MTTVTARKDITGSLIAQLKTLADDIAFHANAKLNLENVVDAYPNLKRTALQALVTSRGLNLGNTERVEKAGFIVHLDRNEKKLTLYTSPSSSRAVSFNYDDHFLALQAELPAPQDELVRRWDQPTLA